MWSRPKLQNDHTAIEECVSASAGCTKMSADQNTCNAGNKMITLIVKIAVLTSAVEGNRTFDSQNLKEPSLINKT